MNVTEGDDTMTNMSKDKDKGKETDEIISAKNKIKKCEIINDKEKKINCLYETFHDITEAQDIVNLTIYKTINNSEDPRWIPTLIADNANAIILEISRFKGHPQSIVRPCGYVEEKIDSLMNRWHSLRSRYRK
jgi:hypothetical protein